MRILFALVAVVAVAVALRMLRTDTDAAPAVADGAVTLVGDSLDAGTEPECAV